MPADSQRSSRRNSCLTAVRPPVRAAASTAAAAAIHAQSRPMAPNSTPIARGIHTAQVNAKASRKKTTSGLRRTNSNVPYWRSAHPQIAAHEDPLEQ